MELKVNINNVSLIVMLMIILFLAMIVGLLKLLLALTTQTLRLLNLCFAKRIHQVANVYAQHMLLTELMLMEDVSLLVIREDNRMMEEQVKMNVGLPLILT